MVILTVQRTGPRTLTETLVVRTPDGWTGVRTLDLTPLDLMMDAIRETAEEIAGLMVPLFRTVGATMEEMLTAIRTPTPTQTRTGT